MLRRSDVIDVLVMITAGVLVFLLLMLVGYRLASSDFAQSCDKLHGAIVNDIAYTCQRRVAP